MALAAVHVCLLPFMKVLVKVQDSTVSTIHLILFFLLGSFQENYWELKSQRYPYSVNFDPWLKL